MKFFIRSKHRKWPENPGFLKVLTTDGNVKLNGRFYKVFHRNVLHEVVINKRNKIERMYSDSNRLLTSKQKFCIYVIYI